MDRTAVVKLVICKLVDHDLTKSPSGSPFSDPWLPMRIDPERPSVPCLIYRHWRKNFSLPPMRNEELQELGELQRRTGQTKGNSIECHSFKRAFLLFVSFIDVSHSCFDLYGLWTGLTSSSWSKLILLKFPQPCSTVPTRIFT